MNSNYNFINLNQTSLDEAERSGFDRVTREAVTEDTRRMYRTVSDEPATADESKPIYGEKPEKIKRNRSDAPKPAGESPRSEGKKGNYYPPSNLPKLGMRFGPSSQTTKHPQELLQKCERKLRQGRVEVENNWSPDGWTIEDGGWEARQSNSE